jgi:hypothetical protein
MSSSDYHFVTHWRVLGTVEEVFAVFEDPTELSRWWPAVYLEVDELTPGGEAGIGRQVRVLTKGWLPYTLRWDFRVTESRRPFALAIEAAGDFAGRGVWRFEQSGAWVDLTYDWKIRFGKRGLAIFSPLLAPVFAANHRWAMRRGEESLRIELERRRAAQSGRAFLGERPPRPTTTSPVPLALAAVALGAAMILLARLVRRPRR